ncbi:Lyso-phosphatidylcholine acyltransferase [Umbelopsis sp. WA50703]
MTIYARSAPFRRKLFTIAGATGVLGGIGYYHYATRPRVNVVGHDTDDPLIGPGLDTARPKKEPLFNLDRIPAFVAKRFETKAPPNGILWNSASNMVMVAVGTTSKFFLKAFAPTKVFNREPFLALLDDEDRERPIITVANHASVLDDPLIWGVIPLRMFCVGKMRWVLGAAEICFTNPASSLFFGLGQVIPTVRGYGIYQPAVDFAIEKANQNCWLHIFPEARVNQQEALLRFKWGVGRIIMESDKCPLVVPMWHTGMSEIRPLNGPPIRLFKPVTIAFGDPIDFQDTLDEWRSGKIDEETARIRITDRIFKTLGELKEKTERMMSDIQSGVKDGEGELRDTSKP